MVDVTVPADKVLPKARSCATCGHSAACPQDGFMFCYEGPPELYLFCKGFLPSGQPEVVQQIAFRMTPKVHCCGRWKSKLLLPG